MDIQNIQFADTHKFSQIVLDYLAGVDALKPFYQYNPNQVDWQQVMQDKDALPVNREILVESIQKQYAALDIDGLVGQHIQAFADANTYCIVTAHQLNIFTGPLYVIYKTLSTIRLCRNLQAQYPQKVFVPVFWLGSEDHDFEEIHHTRMFNKLIQWDDKQGGACGRYQLSTFQPVLDQVAALLGDASEAEKLRTLFVEAYQPEHSLAQASRILLHGLFKEYGLVIVDGDDVALKMACKGIIQDELLRQSSAQVMEKTLSEFPYPPQALGREINLFYIQDNSRERIVLDTATKTYTVLNTAHTFTTEEILAITEQYPERFSPNVILRPVFQQQVLPALAYIGGGGELAYWLQLKDVFSHHHVPFPVVLLRDSVMWIDAATQKKLARLDFSVTALFEPEHTLIERYVRKHADTTVDLSAQVAQVEAMFSPLVQQAAQIDAGLESTVMAERQVVLNALSKLESKLLKAQKSKQETQVKQISSILQKLFPEGGLQERSENFTSLYLRHGQSLFDTLLAASTQPVPQFLVVTEQEPAGS